MEASADVLRFPIAWHQAAIKWHGSGRIGSDKASGQRVGPGRIHKSSPTFVPSGPGPLIPRVGLVGAPRAGKRPGSTGAGLAHVRCRRAGLDRGIGICGSLGAGLHRIEFCDLQFRDISGRGMLPCSR